MNPEAKILSWKSSASTDYEVDFKIPTNEEIRERVKRIEAEREVERLATNAVREPVRVLRIH